MTKTEQLELIRQKCIKANPEKFRGPRRGSEIYDWPVFRLADVLWAVKETDHVLAVRDDGLLLWGKKLLPAMNVPLKEYVRWNLRKDDLTEQSDSVVDFLYTLLKQPWN